MSQIMPSRQLAKVSELMDVSAVNASETKQVFWDPKLQGGGAEDFADILNDQQEPVDPAPDKAVDAREEDYREDDNARQDNSDEPAEKEASDKEPEVATEQAAYIAVPVTDPKTTTTSVVSGNTGENAQTVTQNPSANNSASQQVAQQNTASTQPAQALNTQEANKVASPVQQDAAKTSPIASENAKPTTVAEAQKVSQSSAVVQQVATQQPTRTVAASKTETADNLNQTVVKQGSGENTATSGLQTEAQMKKGQPSTLETLRAEEMAKLSEKDSLSAKISEMLNASSGKISVSAKATASQGTGNLLSGQNAVTTQNGLSPAANTATAIETVTQATQQAETPLNIGGQAAQAPLQAVAEPVAHSTASAPGTAVQGVDATSSNSASQAAASNKAAAQHGAPAEQVSKQITAAVKDGVDRIKVQLNPAELGRVDIKMEIAGDGKIMAVIAAENQDTLDLLQQDSKLLEKALQDAGFDADGDSLNFSLNQGEQDAENLQTASGDADLLSEQDTSEDEGANPAPLYSTNHSSSGGLDIAV